MRIFPAAEAWFTDIRAAFLTPSRSGQDGRIVVVAITEDTLARLPYRSPIDRGFLSQLTTVIDAAGPRAIGFDILFDRPSETDKDESLAAAIRAAEAPVVLGVVAGESALTEAQRTFLSAFREATGALPGYVDLTADSDGSIRRRQDVIAPGHDSLSAALVRAAGGSTPAFTGALTLRAGSGDTPPIPILPAHVILQMGAAQPAVVSGWLSNRIVLIGADLPLNDRHRTALVLREGEPARTAGVLIHAHAISQALDGLRIADTVVWLSVLLALTGALIGAGIAALRWPLWASAPLGLVTVSGYWVLAGVGYQNWEMLIPMTSPVLALVFSFGAGSALLGYATLREKRFVRRAFAQYVPAAVVDRVASNPERLQLGGVRQELTFLFTDIAGFTRMSERMAPEQLGETLNRYLDGISTIVLDHAGTLDKYIGDAVVAFFGAPEAQPDHAARAISCAVAIDGFAEQFRMQHAGAGFGVTRIGVNTGMAIVGNFGGERRFDYTALGDTVNTAARLESANQHLGTRVCVSAAAVEEARASGALLPALRPIGQLVLKGKTQPVKAYEPLAEDDPRLASLANYVSAYNAMAAGQGATALLAFGTIADGALTDGLIAYHRDRLAADSKSTDLIMMEEK